MGVELLYTIPYKDLDLWDVKRYNKNNIKSSFAIEKLGKHIISQIEKVCLYDYPDKDFDILGISNDIGMHDAYTAKGNTFNQPYKMVKNDFIAYNPYRVNVGSIGIKTSEIKGELISPAYVVFSCKESILPNYLFLLMKTDKFNKLIVENTSGSVRQNLTFKALSNIKIPLPSIEIQQKLVDDYNEKINKADAINGFKQFDSYITNELGAFNFDIQKRNKVSLGKCRLKDLTRWDNWSNINNVKSGKYNVVKFGNVLIDKPQYGANVKGSDVLCDYRYIRITDINENGSLNEEIKYPEKVENQYILKENDFLIARSGNTVGKTFLYKKNIGKAIFAGYLVRYLLNTEKIYPEYLWFYTKTTIYKNWVAKNQRIAGQPNINGQEYLEFPLILPPFDKQKEIAQIAQSMLNEHINSNNNALNLINTAKEDFERAIFS